MLPGAQGALVHAGNVGLVLEQVEQRILGIAPQGHMAEERLVERMVNVYQLASEETPGAFT